MEIKRITPLITGKKPWKRLVAADAEVPGPTNAGAYTIPAREPDGLRYQYLTEFDLLNESCEGAHLINSKYMSRRPVYRPATTVVQVPVLDADGKAVLNPDGTPLTQPKEVRRWVIERYEDIETVRSGLPELIIKQKASHLAKNGIEIANEGSDHGIFDRFRAHKDLAGIDAAWMQAVYACCKAGDALVYLYVDGGAVEYTVFGAVYGDQVFACKDDKGADMAVRRYMLAGREAVDVFMDDYIETYVRGAVVDGGEGADAGAGAASWWATVRGWFRNIARRRTADGWERISRSPSQLGLGMCQAIYLRMDDTPIGPAMQNINAWERGASYVSDKVRSMAFSKLFLKTSKIKNLPPLSSGEEVIGVENADADILRASEAGYLTPPDISNIATINLKNLTDAIMQSTMSIDLQPEILKSGADSSQTLKLLLRREIQWAQVTWPQVRHAARRIIEVLKALVAKLEGDERFRKLMVSVWNTPWMPVDEAAQISNVEKLVYAGILSRENARHELNLQYTDDAALVGSEAAADLYRKTFEPLRAQAEAEARFGPGKAPQPPESQEDPPDAYEGPEQPAPKIDNRAAARQGN